MSIDRDAVFALNMAISDQVIGLTSEERLVLFHALLAQEICMLPPSERARQVNRTLSDFPDMVRSTEEGMRQALAEDARDGGA